MGGPYAPRPYNPYYEDAWPPRRPRIRYSRIELQHLAGAVVLLTLAFAFVLDRDARLETLTFPAPLTIVAALAAVGSGFVLHELAHKVVAQRYGHWAEFRAQFAGLGISLLIAVFLKILFAAPGAVMISGRVTPRENGIISLVGPGVNFIIAVVALPFAFAIDPTAPVPHVARVVAFVNALLAVFNLLPIGPLDGKKVWHWSKGTYLASMAVSAGLLAITLMYASPFRG